MGEYISSTKYNKKTTTGFALKNNNREKISE
jgi:hypothetical protein